MRVQLMEVTAWTQLGVHTKRMFHTADSINFLTLFTAVVLLNVLGFFDPLRALIKSAMAFGFINAQNGNLMTFVDCPPDVDPATFDWGAAALSALNGWRAPGPGYFVWTLSSVDANSIATY
jgi:predicted Rossmann-fold nucleotide-binding protein